MDPQCREIEEIHDDEPLLLCAAAGDLYSPCCRGMDPQRREIEEVLDVEALVGVAIVLGHETCTSSDRVMKPQSRETEELSAAAAGDPYLPRRVSCTIFKAPKHIRQLDHQAYQPVVSPIGPFHHQSQSSAMQDYKWSCARQLLSHHGNEDRHVLQSWNECLLKLKKLNDKVRLCYSQQFEELDDHNMALIMLLDGCFIIYLMLYKYWRKESLEVAGEVKKEDEEEDKKFENLSMAGISNANLVVCDLLKLENQIPFFIIHLLFEHLKIHEDENIELVELALELFRDIHPKKSKSFKKKSPTDYHHLLHLFYSSRIPTEEPQEPPEEYHHLLHLVCSSRIPSENPAGSKMNSRSTSAPKWTPNATELDRAGVKFKKEESADSFLNITFEQKKMKIMPLQIYDYTGPLLRNLIAFEQCYYNTEMYITIYTLFMDSIIDQADDVHLLNLEGILEHKLSNDQAVAELFNQLCCQIRLTWKKNYLANQIEKKNEFYTFKWHKWVSALLKRDYFDKPWAKISVLVGIVLLLLTVEQDVFSVFSYFHSS